MDARMRNHTKTIIQDRLAEENCFGSDEPNLQKGEIYLQQLLEKIHTL